MLITNNILLLIQTILSFVSSINKESIGNNLYKSTKNVSPLPNFDSKYILPTPNFEKNGSKNRLYLLFFI